MRLQGKNLNCFTGIDWVKYQVAIWEFYYEKRDIRKKIHPASFPVSIPKKCIDTAHQRLHDSSPLNFSDTKQIAICDDSLNISYYLEHETVSLEENNIPCPNAAMLELKSARKSANSMITLLTKSPLPRGSNTNILNKFGYPSSRGNGRLELHTTVNGVDFNTIKGNVGLKIGFAENRINLLSANDIIECYWTREILYQSLRRKIQNLLLVKADSHGRGKHEEF